MNTDEGPEAPGGGVASGGTPRTGVRLPERFTLAVHGLPVEVECGVARLLRPLDRLLGGFAVPVLPAGFLPTSGFVQPYDPAEVSRYLSPTARRMSGAGTGLAGGELMEVFEEGERFWIVDDRWGLAEINLLRGTWRSWILPEPKLDPLRCVEAAVLWPMAQLLRGKGVHLLPAASAVRDGWAVLMLSPFSLEPELTTLLEHGFRLIGQRWTAVREEEDRLALLQMPGWVERPFAPRLRIGFVGRPDAAEGGADDADLMQRAGYGDLTSEYRGACQSHAFCDAVAVVEPGRRMRSQLRTVPPAQAAALLRRVWPILELHPTRRQPQLPPKLARQCRCGEMHLSRDPRDLLTLLSDMRAGPLVIGQSEPVEDPADADAREAAA